MHSVPFVLPAVDALHRPDLRAAILSMPVARTLGLRVVGFTSGVSVIELDVRPEVTFDGRTVQGGIVGTLADFAGVSAATATLPPGGAASTTGFEVHHLSPAQGERLVAVGRAAFVGKSHAVSRVEVHALQERRESILVAIGTTTCRLILPAVPREG
ncbi:PaaI family thioesterase [Deinococcus oregonensis]|uniref:PaaI family thioesterase n=1 Tax=Deinococcus oregonensis TaxID=1805970 RepID=A0ABV6AVY4_9DEIO